MQFACLRRPRSVGYPPTPQLNVELKLTECVARAINIASQHCMGDGVPGFGRFRDCWGHAEAFQPLSALAIFIPSTDPENGFVYFVVVCTTFLE